MLFLTDSLTPGSSKRRKIDALSSDQTVANDINNLNTECSSILIDAANGAGFIKEVKVYPPRNNYKVSTKPTSMV